MAPKTDEQIKALNEAMHVLLTAYHPRKVVLYRNDKVAEEVWAVPFDAVEDHLYASTTSYNQPLIMRLLNRPKDFASKDWGDAVKCRTNRMEKPYAHEFENLKASSVTEEEWYGQGYY